MTFLSRWIHGPEAPLQRFLARLKHPGGLLAVICLAALALRLIGLDTRSLWGDELFTLAHALGRMIRPETLALLGQAFDPMAPQPASAYLAQYFSMQGAWWDPAPTVRVLAMNNHPPLFFWLMRPVIALVGLEPALLRLPALLCGLACVPMVFLLGRRLHSAPVGVLAAAMMAFSGYQVFHAQDARPYTLITLLALTSAWLLLTLLAAGPGLNGRRAAGWLLWALLGVAGLYTHYFFVPFWAFLSGYGLLRAMRQPTMLGALGGASLLVLAAFWPWWPVLKAQMQWITHEGHFTHGRWEAIQAPEIVWRMLCEYVAPKSPLIRLALALALAYGLGVLVFMRRQSLRLSRLTLFCLLWLVCVEGFLIVYDSVFHTSLLTVRRYGLLAAPAFYLLIAHVLMSIKTRERGLRGGMITGLLGWMLLASLWIVLDHGLTASDARSAAHYIATSAPAKRQAVLVNPSGPATLAMALYLPPDTPLLGLPVRSLASAADRQAVGQRLQAVIRHTGRLWLTYHDSAPSARLFIEQTLGDHQFFSSRRQHVSGIDVVLYERFQPAAAVGDTP